MSLKVLGLNKSGNVLNKSNFERSSEASQNLRHVHEDFYGVNNEETVNIHIIS